MTCKENFHGLKTKGLQGSKMQNVHNVNCASVSHFPVTGNQFQFSENIWLHCNILKNILKRYTVLTKHLELALMVKNNNQIVIINHI